MYLHTWYFHALIRINLCDRAFACERPNFDFPTNSATESALRPIVKIERKSEACKTVC